MKRRFQFARLLKVAFGLSAVLTAPFAVSRPRQYRHQVVVTVTDRSDRYQTTLRAEDFIVEVGGVQHAITGLTRTREPKTLGLVVDNSVTQSFSMEAELSVTASFMEAMSPDDELFLMATNSSGTALLQDYTHDRGLLTRQLFSIQSLYVGNTDVARALLLAGQKLKAASNQKRVALLVSDGSALQEMPTLLPGILFYSIQVLPPLSPLVVRPSNRPVSNSLSTRRMGPPPLKPEIEAQIEARRAVAGRIMQRIAEESGARCFVLRTEQSLNPLFRQFDVIYHKLYSEFESQYVLTFEGPSEGSIRIKTVNPAYSVRYALTD